jgi:hypothetical protein
LAQLRANLGSHFAPDDIEMEVSQWRRRNANVVPEWDVVALSLIDAQHQSMLQCIACEDRAVSIKIEQCEHAVLCDKCLVSMIELAERRKTAAVQCPLCRAPVGEVSIVEQPVLSDAEHAQERTTLLTALNMPKRVSAAVLLATSGLSLRLCLLALSETNDNVRMAAVWLRKQSSEYVCIRNDNLIALERVVEKEFEAASPGSE